MNSGDEDSEIQIQSPSSLSQDGLVMDTENEKTKTANQLLAEDFEFSGSDSDSSGPRKDGSKSPKSSDSESKIRRTRKNSSSNSSDSDFKHGSPKSRKSKDSGSLAASPKSQKSEDSGPRRETSKHSDSESESDSAGSRPGTPKDLKSKDSGGSLPKPFIFDSDSDSKPGSLKSDHSGSRRVSPKHSGSESDGRVSRAGTPSKNEGDRENEEDEPEVKAEEEEEPLPETRIDVEIPKITTDLGKSVHFVKLPNFLSVETRPFDPNTYEDEIDDEETLDEEGRARLKLKVENTIRWRERFNEKGVFVKESNARFVKWSDGSLSLHLGDEIFNVEKQALLGDHNHLFIRQGTGLQGQAVFRTKLTFRPHSTESFTHRKMTMSLADRSTKAQGIKVLSTVGADPEAKRGEMIKKEDVRLRASVRRENKQRRVREKASLKGLSSSYIDDEYSEDDNSISISAIKNKYKKGGPRAHIYSSDEDDASDLEHGRRLEKAKRLKDSEEEEDDKSDNERIGSPPQASVQDSAQPQPDSSVPDTSDIAKLDASDD